MSSLRPPRPAAAATFLLVLAAAGGGCGSDPAPSKPAGAGGTSSGGGGAGGSGGSTQSGTAGASTSASMTASSASGTSSSSGGGSCAALAGKACTPGEPPCSGEGPCAVECTCVTLNGSSTWSCPAPSAMECHCPSEQPQHMAPCERVKVACEDHPPPCVESLYPQCSYGTPSCPTECTCTDFQGGSRWVCPAPAGPECGSACPTQAPPGGQAVDCAGFEGSLCAWLNDEEGCSAVCSCHELGGSWNCKYDCSCPSSKPADGDACTEEQYQKGCAYGEPCESACVCSGSTAKGLDWDCMSCGGGCPGTPPANGSACDPEKYADHCIYNENPYCGWCFCEASGWNCSPSSCDKCPETAPSNGESCDGLQDQHCEYDAGMNKKTSCSCDGMSWICNTT